MAEGKEDSKKKICDRLKDLPPEERIKKLKEIEKKNKEEIEEAQELIKKSEEEIEKEEFIKENIPIPQVKAEDISELTTEEEKEVFRTRRFKRKERKEEESLEETVEKEKVEELSRMPEEDIREQMQEIMYGSEERGYLSQEDMNQIYALEEAERQKLYDIEEGEYAPEDSESIKDRISSTFEMAKKLKSMYQSQDELYKT